MPTNWSVATFKKTANNCLQIMQNQVKSWFQQLLRCLSKIGSIIMLMLSLPPDIVESHFHLTAENSLEDHQIPLRVSSFTRNYQTSSTACSIAFSMEDTLVKAVTKPPRPILKKSHSHGKNSSFYNIMHTLPRNSCDATVETSMPCPMCGYSTDGSSDVGTAEERHYLTNVYSHMQMDELREQLHAYKFPPE